MRKKATRGGSLRERERRGRYREGEGDDRRNKVRGSEEKKEPEAAGRRK